MNAHREQVDQLVGTIRYYLLNLGGGALSRVLEHIHSVAVQQPVNPAVEFEDIPSMAPHLLERTEPSSRLTFTRSQGPKSK